MKTLAALALLFPVQEVEPGADWPEATLLGRSLCRAGDVDGDGVEDYAAGAPLAGTGETRAGAVVIFSGATGESLRVIWGAVDDGWFGAKLRSAGDLDGDGAAELLVGQGDTALLVSAVSGEVLWETEAALAHVGWLGDVDGDEVAELFLGDGRRASILSTAGEPVPSRLSRAKRVRFVGDVDGDGYAEVARLHREEPPMVEILAGPDWSTREHLTLPVEWEEDLREMRFAVADVDGDGTRDYVLSTPRWAVAGAVYAFSGIDGEPLWWRRGKNVKLEEYGESLLAVGDVNGDGKEDVAVGAPSWINSRVSVLSGHDGAEIWTIKGRRKNRYAAEEIGTDLDLIADRDGDGVAELLVGSGCFTAHGVWCPTGHLRIVSGASGKVLHELGELELPELRVP
jgi:hypothetical protein